MMFYSRSVAGWRDEDEPGELSMFEVVYGSSTHMTYAYMDALWAAMRIIARN